MDLKKTFAGGGLDLDSAFEYVAQNDFIGALNIRVTGTEGSEAGSVTSIEGNEKISFPVQPGTNKAHGSKFFPNVGKIYFFLFNSLGNHSINEYDQKTKSVRAIFVNKVNSAGKDILPLSANHKIKDIELIDGKILKFNDGNISPKEIDVTYNYGVFFSDDLEQIKAQPVKPPIAKYRSDPSKSANLISKSIFQFRYKYVYFNDEHSAWSSYSRRDFPIDEPTPAKPSETRKNNGQQIGVYVGSDRVKQIIVSARKGNSDWQTIKIIDRAKAVALPYKQLNFANSVYEAYNSDGELELDLNDPYRDDVFNIAGLYTFMFFNDGAYDVDDPLEGDLDSDYLPRAANAMKLANGNVMLFGGLKEGYKRPDTKVFVIPEYYDPKLEIIATDFSDAIRARTTASVGSQNNVKINLYLYGLPKTGDRITVKVIDPNTRAISVLGEYVVPAANNNSTTRSAAGLAATIPGAYTEELVKEMLVVFITPPGTGLASVDIDHQNKTSGASKSIPIVKSNSSYQLALRYRDRFGRPFPLRTGEDMIVSTEPISVTNGMVPRVIWNIETQAAPIGAHSYQFLMSNNTTHLKQLGINGKVLDVVDSSYLTISLKSLVEFNKENPTSILSYQYAPGDRCTFNYFYDGSSSSPTYFSPYPIDVEVMSFEVINASEDDPTVIDYVLKVRRPDSVSASGTYQGRGSIIGKEVVMEIYSPQAAPTSEETRLFFEVGDVYLVKEDGTHSVTSGVISEGGAYYRTRENASGSGDSIGVFRVESLHFSDYYPSDVSSFGRPASMYDTPEDVFLPASIRYSEMFNKFTRSNGLNRFFPSRIVDNDEVYGAIKFLHQRDNVIICVQETKVGYIPVFQSIIEDQAGQNNVAVSDSFLNKIRYSKGSDIGIGSLIDTFAAGDGMSYFLDPNRGEPIRVGLDGVQRLGKKMTQFFEKSTNSASYVSGYYDGKNMEYILIFVYPDGKFHNVVYSEKTDKWSSFYSYSPEDAVTADTGFHTLKNGELYIHTDLAPRNRFYGIENPSTINMVFNEGPDIVKSLKSIELRSNVLLSTTENGVKTAMGQVSDLIEDDFVLYKLKSGAKVYGKEGLFTANFLRDKNTGIKKGDILKGRTFTVELTTGEQKKFSLFSVTVKADVSY